MSLRSFAAAAAVLAAGCSFPSFGNDLIGGRGRAAFGTKRGFKANRRKELKRSAKRSRR